MLGRCQIIGVYSCQATLNIHPGSEDRVGVLDPKIHRANPALILPSLHPIKRGTLVCLRLSENGHRVSKFKSFCLRSIAILALVAILDCFAQAQNQINVGVAGPAINLIYAYVAQDAGLWKKYGLDSRVTTFEAGSTLAQVARTGEIKFAINSGISTVASRAQGADTIIVAAPVNKLPYSLVTTKAITKWADLRGKKVGISRFGSGTDTAIRLLCRKFGLDPSKDIIIFQGGTQPSRLQGLLAGILDATLVSPPLDFVAKKQGLNILTNAAELDIFYPPLVIESTDRFNRENPHSVKNFLKGFIEGMRYIATHKDETKKTITRYLTKSHRGRKGRCPFALLVSRTNSAWKGQARHSKTSHSP